MHVQIGQVGGAQRDEVSVGAEVGLQVGDRHAVLGDGQHQRRGPPGDQVAIEVDLVAVDLGDPAGVVADRLVDAGHRQVGPEGRRRPARRGEVGEGPVDPAHGQIQQYPPGAVGVHNRVQMLVAGGVAAHHDQVQPLGVLLVERGHRDPVRAGDAEGEVVDGSRGQRRGGGREGVAAPARRQPGGLVCGLRDGAAVDVPVPGVLDDAGACVPGRRCGGGGAGQGTDSGSGRVRPECEQGERRAVGGELRKSVHDDSLASGLPARPCPPRRDEGQVVASW